MADVEHIAHERVELALRQRRIRYRLAHNLGVVLQLNLQTPRRFGDCDGVAGMNALGETVAHRPDAGGAFVGNRPEALEMPDQPIAVV